MTRRGYRPEQIIDKLREVEILLSQGSTIGEAIRKIVVTEQTCSLAGYREVFLHQRREDTHHYIVSDVGSPGRTPLELFSRKIWRFRSMVFLYESGSEPNPDLS